MRRGRPTAALILSEAERESLEAWCRKHSTSQALALRARIILASATGETNTAVAAQVGVTKQTVGKW